MKKIHTGEDATLRTYRNIAYNLTEREESEVVKYFDDLIVKLGADTEVSNEEIEMLQLIVNLIITEKDEYIEKLESKSNKNFRLIQSIKDMFAY